jgi:hypothetical protein
VDRAIREATERGEFENLPGKGKPLPDSGPHDDMWWVRQFALREDAGDAFLPRSLLLRKEAADLPDRVRKLNTETAVRAAVTELNERIRAEVRLPTGGPPLHMAPLDVETVVAGWQADREDRRAEAERIAAERAAAAAAARSARRPWWQRRR